MEVIQIALNAYVQGIDAWSKEHKLTIDSEKTNFSIVLTDRNNQGSFYFVIKLFGSEISQISNHRYLGLILDAEIRFSQQLYHILIKSLKKSLHLRDFVALHGDQIQGPC